MDVTPTQQNKPTNSSETQLKIFKAISVALAALLVIVVGAYFIQKQIGKPTAIMVNGTRVAVASGMAAAFDAVVKAEKAQLGSGGRAFQTQCAEKIEYVRLPDNEPVTVDSPDTIASRLAPVLHVSVRGYVITVDNTRAVGLPTEELAHKVLDGVMTREQNAPPADPIVGKPRIKNKTVIVRQTMPAALACGSVDRAVDILTTPPPPQTYVVRRGDLGVKICRKFHLKYSAFLQANAGKDVNRIIEGDIVNVSAPNSILTVLVDKQSSRTEPIRRGVPADKAGLRQITMITTYANGVPVGAAKDVAITTVKPAAPWREVY